MFEDRSSNHHFATSKGCKSLRHPVLIAALSDDMNPRPQLAKNLSKEPQKPKAFTAFSKGKGKP